MDEQTTPAPLANPLPAEFEFRGYRVYPSRIKAGEEIREMWAVESEENRERRLAGDRNRGGDLLFPDPDAARREVDRLIPQAEQRLLDNRAAEQAATAAAEARLAREADSINGFLDGMAPHRKALARTALEKRYRFRGRGEMSVRELIDQLQAAGELQIRIEEVDKIKPLTKLQHFRASYEQQKEHERRIKEAGKKTVYWVNNYDSLGKTAYDYADHVLRNAQANLESSSVTKSEMETHAENPSVPAPMPVSDGYIFGMSPEQIGAMQGGKMESGDWFDPAQKEERDAEVRSARMARAQVNNASFDKALLDAIEEPRLRALHDGGVESTHIVKAAWELNKDGDDSLLLDLARIYGIALPPRAQPHEEAGRPFDARTAPKGYWTTEGYDKEWRHCTQKSFQPTSRQAVLMGALQAARDAGITDAKCLKTFVIEQLALNDATLNHGLVGGEGVSHFDMELFKAREALDAQAMFVKEAEAIARLNLTAGDNLGSLQFADFKLTNCVEVESVSSDGAIIHLTGKRGAYSVKFEASPLQIICAIDRAASSGKRSEDAATLIDQRSRAAVTSASVGNGEEPLVSVSPAQSAVDERQLDLFGFAAPPESKRTGLRMR